MMTMKNKIFWEIEAGPGETKTETFTAPNEAGTYKVVCGASCASRTGYGSDLGREVGFGAKRVWSCVRFVSPGSSEVRK